MQRPTTVSAASWIWLFAALFTSFSIVNVMAATGFLTAMTGLMAEDENDLVATGIIGTLGSILAIAMFVAMLIQVVSAVKFRDGARWTRIVLVIVTVISLLAVIFDVTSVAAWGVLVANVAAVALAFAPPSTEFLSGRRRATAGA